MHCNWCSSFSSIELYCGIEDRYLMFDGCICIKACHPNPCLRGGTCWVSSGTFFCACKPGLSGDRCQGMSHHCYLPLLLILYAIVGYFRGILSDVMSPFQWLASFGYVTSHLKHASNWCWELKKVEMPGPGKTFH